jgi:hypothetical protein
MKVVFKEWKIVWTLSRTSLRRNFMRQPLTDSSGNWFEIDTSKVWGKRVTEDEVWREIRGELPEWHFGEKLYYTDD